MPYLIKHNSGEGMAKRLGDLIEYFKRSGDEFTTYYEFAKSIKL